MFNPGVVYRNGQFKMLYRGQAANTLSQTGYAPSTDGLNFSRYANNPVITNNVPHYDTDGVQDPRLYELNGTYYSFLPVFTATSSSWSPPPPT